MAQTIIVSIIVLLAAAAAGVKLCGFFKKRAPGSECSPDACASCPYHTDTACDEKKLK